MSIDALSLPPGLSTWFPVFVSGEMSEERQQAWLERTHGTILAELPELEQLPDLTMTLADAVREHWLAFLAVLPQPEFTFHLVESGVDLAREVAAHQLPLETLIRIYRAAQQASWQYVTEIVQEAPDETLDHTELLIYFWTRASAWIDTAITESVGIYQAEQARAQAGVSARRYEVVQELLDGGDKDPRRMSAAFGGYPLTAHHTAMILEVDRAEAAGDLERLAQQAARLLGGSRPLVVAPGGRQVWAWTAHRSAPELERLDELVPTLTRAGATLRVGASAEGVEGFISSHRDAERAGRLTEAVGRTPGPLVRYDDVELLALLGCSPEVDRFTRRTLGDLGADTPSMTRVRETVSSYLHHGLNLDEAAIELCVHRNTVRYRLAQAESALGRPVTRSLVELQLAIRHHEAFHAERDAG